MDARADVSRQAGRTLANTGEFGSLVAGEASRSLASGLQRGFLREPGAGHACHDKILVGADARPHFGEPRRVEADDVRRQRAGTVAVVELNHGVARVNPGQPAVTGEMGGFVMVAAVAEVFVLRQPRSTRRRRRPAGRPADDRALAAITLRKGTCAQRTGNARRPERAVVGFLGSRSSTADPHDCHHAAERRRDFERIFGGTQPDHRDLFLRQRDRERLFGIFEIDHLRDQSAAIDHVVEIVLREDDPHRVLAGIDRRRPMQVADDLDDRKDLDARPFRKIR